MAAHARFVSRFLILPALILLWSLTASPVFAQISGRLLHEATGAPAGQIPVTLRNFTDMSINQTATDPSGNFAFSASRGVYYISIRHPGYMEISERVEVGISSTNGLVLFLRPMPTKDGSQNQATASRFTVPAELLKVPEKAREFYRAGLREFARNGNLAESQKLFQKALEAYPEFAEAHYWQGMIQLDLAEYENARSSFEEAIRLNEKLAAAYFPLGSLHLHFQDPAKAAVVLHKGLAQFDKYWQGHFEIARAYVALGKLKEAEASALRTQELKPDFHRVLVLLANIYWDQNRDAEALAAAEKFLKLAPEDPVAPQIALRVQQIKNPQKP